MKTSPAKPRNTSPANPAGAANPDAETRSGGLPCQRWARRCLERREQDLAADLRALYRVRQASAGQGGTPGQSADDTLRRVIAALTAIQTVLSQWPRACVHCPAPVELLRPGNVARCQVLRAALDHSTTIAVS